MSPHHTKDYLKTVYADSHGGQQGNRTGPHHLGIGCDRSYSSGQNYHSYRVQAL